MVTKYKGYFIVPRSGINEEGQNKFCYGIVRLIGALTNLESELVYDSPEQAEKEAKQYVDQHLTAHE